MGRSMLEPSGLRALLVQVAALVQGPFDEAVESLSHWEDLPKWDLGEDSSHANPGLSVIPCSKSLTDSCKRMSGFLIMCYFFVSIMREKWILLVSHHLTSLTHT